MGNTVSAENMTLWGRHSHCEHERVHDEVEGTISAQ